MYFYPSAKGGARRTTENKDDGKTRKILGKLNCSQKKWAKGLYSK